MSTETMSEKNEPSPLDYLRSLHDDKFSKYVESYDVGDDVVCKFEYTPFGCTCPAITGVMKPMPFYQACNAAASFLRGWWGIHGHLKVINIDNPEKHMSVDFKNGQKVTYPYA